MTLKLELSKRIGISSIREIVYRAKKDEKIKVDLYHFAFDDNETLSVNALWIMTHYDTNQNQWLYGKQEELIDELLKTKNSSKQRLLLTLLYKQPVATSIRVDFLDFCLQQITPNKEQPGITVLCMKMAYEMCRSIPELLQEYRAIISSVEWALLPPSLRSAHKQIAKAMQTGKSLQLHN